MRACDSSCHCLLQTSLRFKVAVEGVIDSSGPVEHFALSLNEALHSTRLRVVVLLSSQMYTTLL